MLLKNLYIVFIGILLFPFMTHTATSPAQGTKADLMRSTPAQFSGALQWVHKRGFTGKGQTIFFLEVYDDILLKKLKKSLKGQLTLPQNRFLADSHNHAADVLFVSHLIAPHANLAVAFPANFGINIDPEKRQKKLSNITLLQTDRAVLLAPMKQAIVLNCSFKIFLFLPAFLRSINFTLSQGEKKLLIMSAGNEGQESITNGQDLNTAALYKMGTDPSLNPSLIIVGGLSQQFANRFNYPGDDTTIQDIYLCTLGAEFKEFDDEGGFANGTSLAAPIVSASVALLKEAFPSLSVFNIKECLLESASKNFFVRDYFRRSTSHGTFVYDPEEGPPDLKKLRNSQGEYSWPEEHNILTEPFDPYVYGKGVLDLRAAFIYAQLKVDHPAWGKEQLRTEMKRLLKQQDTKAATTIQTAYRKHFAGKKLKNDMPPPSYDTLFPSSY